MRPDVVAYALRQFGPEEIGRPRPGDEQRRVETGVDRGGSGGKAAGVRRREEADVVEGARTRMTRLSTVTYPAL